MITQYDDDTLEEQIRKLNKRLDKFDYRLSKLENNTIDNTNILMYKSTIHLFLATIFRVKMKLDNNSILNLHTYLLLFNFKDNEKLIENTDIDYSSWQLFADYFKLQLNDYDKTHIDQDTFDTILDYSVQLQYDMSQYYTTQLVDMYDEIKYFYLRSHVRSKKILWTSNNFTTDDPTEMKIYLCKKDLRHYLHHIYEINTEEYGDIRPIYYQYNRSLQIFISTRITCTNWIILFDLCNVADYSNLNKEEFIKDVNIIKEHFKYLRKFMNDYEEVAVDDFISVYLT